jgi:hypothetical protein
MASCTTTKVENFLTNRVVEAQDGKERASPSLADHVQR